MKNFLNITINTAHSKSIQLFKTSISTQVIVALFLFGFIVCSPARSEEKLKFREVRIEPLYNEVLAANPDFMKHGGAQVFELANGRRVLIGIAVFIPSDNQASNIPEITRIGAIKARAAVLEYIDGVEISTVRESRDIENSQETRNKPLSLEVFFQATKTESKDRIQQLPVIGTWWAKDGNIFYVAVGTASHGPAIHEGKNRSAASGNTDENIPDMKGDPFFISLLKASPVLVKHGGVRCFILNDGQKAIISVASAGIDDSRVKAKKIARMKAIRSLIAQQNGLEVSSVQYLIDAEAFQICGHGIKRASLSEFFSIQGENISGLIRALPVVAEWEDADKNLYIALGKR